MMMVVVMMMGGDLGMFLTAVSVGVDSWGSGAEELWLSMFLHATI